MAIRIKVSLELLAMQRNRDMKKIASFSPLSLFAPTFNMLFAMLQDIPVFYDFSNSFQQLSNTTITKELHLFLGPNYSGNFSVVAVSARLSSLRAGWLCKHWRECSQTPALQGQKALSQQSTSPHA